MLCHFLTWTNIIRYRRSGLSDYAIMFDSIVEQAPHRDLIICEALALVRAFAGYLTKSVDFRLFEPDDETNIVPQPLLYTLAIGLSESARETHLAITLLLVRAARLSVRTELSQWGSWITFMLWIGIPKDPRYLDALQKSIADNEGTRKIWGEIEMTSASVAVQGPYIEEIARVLWGVDNKMMGSLSRDAFEDPRTLASDGILF
jgi:hypothetical protein